MINQKTKNILLGLGSIILYFIIELNVTTLFKLFGSDIAYLDSTIKKFYLLIVDVFLIATLLLINHERIENDFKDMLKNHKKYFSSCMKYWLIGIAIMYISNFIIMLISNTDMSGNETIIRDIIKTSPIYLYISGVFFAPIVEELVFRLSFRNVFKNKYVFIILSGLFFGAIHVFGTTKNTLDYLYIIPYTSLGCSFAYMLYKTKNYFTSVGFHFMHNGILISLQIFLLLFS